MIANSINPNPTPSFQRLVKNIDLKLFFYLDIWNQLWGQVCCVTIKLYKWKLTLDKAVSLIQALKNSLQELRKYKIRICFYSKSGKLVQNTKQEEKIEIVRKRRR